MKPNYLSLLNDPRLNESVLNDPEFYEWYVSQKREISVPGLLLSVIATIAFVYAMKRL